MKVTVRQIISVYKILGDAKVSKLEESDIIKIVKSRKAMRHIVEDYEAFLKDVKEKFKPENWDELQTKIQQWQKEGEDTTISKSERILINKTVIDYTNKINSAVEEELNKEVEIAINTLTEDTITKLLVDNDWEVKTLDELEIML